MVCRIVSHRIADPWIWTCVCWTAECIVKVVNISHLTDTVGIVEAMKISWLYNPIPSTFLPPIRPRKTPRWRKHSAGEDQSQRDTPPTSQLLPTIRTRAWETSGLTSTRPRSAKLAAAPGSATATPGSGGRPSWRGRAPRRLPGRAASGASPWPRGSSRTVRRRARLRGMSS